jgi:hypothetical protein
MDADEPIDPYGGRFTMRAVYDYEADEYLDHLFGQAVQEPPPAPPLTQFVSRGDEQPSTSLREELEAMGWFTDM